MEGPNDRTFFDRFSYQVSFEDHNNIEKYLEWCNELPEFCSLFASTLTLVKTDIEGNLKKIREAKENEHCDSFDELFKSEKNNKRASLDSSGSTGSLWLYRAVEFVMEFLISLLASKKFDGTNQAKETREIVNQAYERSLKRHHNFIVSNVFQQVTRLAPYKTNIIAMMKMKKIGVSNDEVSHQKFLSFDSLLTLSTQILYSFQVYESIRKFLQSYIPLVQGLYEKLVEFQIETRRQTEFDLTCLDD